MKRITVPLFTALFVLAVIGVSLSAPRVDARIDEQTYNCDPIYYPDGTEGVAVVKVIMSSDGEAAVPTVMVTVDYYSEGSAKYLGRYEDWSSSSDFPNDEYEAEAFALKYFNERW